MFLKRLKKISKKVSALRRICSICNDDFEEEVGVCLDCPMYDLDTLIEYVEAVNDERESLHTALYKAAYALHELKEIPVLNLVQRRGYINTAHEAACRVLDKYPK